VRIALDPMYIGEKSIQLAPLKASQAQELFPTTSWLVLKRPPLIWWFFYVKLIYIITF